MYSSKEVYSNKRKATTRPDLEMHRVKFYYITIDKYINKFYPLDVLSNNNILTVGNIYNYMFFYYSLSSIFRIYFNAYYIVHYVQAIIGVKCIMYYYVFTKF